MTRIEPLWLRELDAFLRIPSVSTDGARAGDVVRAAEWVRDFVRRAGGVAHVELRDGRPITLGRLPARAPRAPTVLIYGHVDVQPPDPLEAWEVSPFAATVRDGWLYGRGTADDKGQLYMLLRAAADLAAGGELPVNVLVVCDGEEEIGGDAVTAVVDELADGLEAAIVFDTPMPERGVPALYVGARGIVFAHIIVRTGASDLHSGVYGGAALNALHVLVRVLDFVLARDGRLPPVLTMGVLPPSEQELESWKSLEAGASILAARGASAADAGATDAFYRRTLAEPALDLHGAHAGAPGFVKTIVPVVAEADLSVRLAPGQEPERIATGLERTLRSALPPGAELELSVRAAIPPARVDPDSPVLARAADAFEAVLGVRPLLLRSGGSLPVLSALCGHGIPTVVGGFAVPESNMHAPNERLPSEHLGLGMAAATELLRRLGGLETARRAPNPRASAAAPPRPSRGGR